MHVLIDPPAAAAAAAAAVDGEVAVCVEAPMILWHEAAGRVVATGPEVEEFKIGDGVCMEPAILDPTSRASKLGVYNVDPSLTF